MATISYAASQKRAAVRRASLDKLGQYVVPVARCLFAAIFVFASFGHFTSATIAGAAAHGVPMAKLLVPISGFLALFGGLSIALGYKTRIGAWLIVLFLVPVTLMMHNFWIVSDPVARHMQQIMFMKNVAILGGALLLTWFGAGPISIDRRK